MANYTDYVSLISQSISDFDSIFTALKNKGVKYLGGTLTTADATYGDSNQYLPTSKYADLIGQLDLVGGGGTLDEVTGASEGGSLTLTPATDGTGKLTFEIVIPKRAVYSATASLTKEITLVDKKFTNLATAADNQLETISADGKVTGYKFKSLYSPTASLLNSVSIDAGEIGVISATGTPALTTEAATISIATGASINADVITVAEPADKDDYVAVDLTSSGSLSGTIELSAVTAKGFKEGYIGSADGLTAEAISLAKQTVSGTGTVYIKKTSVSKITSTGVIGVKTDNTSIIAGSGEDSYDIVISVGNSEADTKGENGGKVTASSTIEEGYLAAGTAEAEITIKDQTLKIKKGSIAAAAEAIDVTPVVSTTLRTTDDASGFEITVANPIANKTLSNSLALTPGYIKDATIPAPNITGESQTIKLAAGSISAAVSVNKATISGDTGIFATGTIEEVDKDKYYAITPSATASVSQATVVEGYVKNANQIEITNDGGETAVSGDTKYIAKGAVSVSATATLAPTGDTTHTNAFTLDDATPSSGHFYTVAVTPTVNITTGYITDSNKTVTVTPITKYIKEAVLEYVQDSDDDKGFIQVKSAGYIASGIISDFLDSSSKPDYADITISTSSTLVKTSATGLADYITIPLSKTINAGYISDTNGKVSLPTLYMEKSTVTTKAALSDATGDWTQSAVSKTETGYKLTVSGKAVSSATLTAGYAEAAADSFTSETEFTKDVTLSKAVISVGGTAEIESTTSGGVLIDPASTYKISSTLKASELTVNVGTAGYIGTDDGITGSISSAGVTGATVGIKAGTGIATQDADAATLTLAGNFDETVNASTNYTVSVTTSQVSATATLAEGYYGSTNSSVTATKSVSGSVSVAHGKLTSTVSAGTLGLNTSSLVVYDTLDEGAGIEITPTIGDVSINYSLTQGYIKTADLDSSAKNISVTSTTVKKLRKYGAVTKYINDAGESVDAERTTEMSGHTGTVTPSTIATAGGIVEDATIHTAGTYAESDIFIPLGANAAGTNVVADLTRLQKRLLGQPTSA